MADRLLPYSYTMWLQATEMCGACDSPRQVLEVNISGKGMGAEGAKDGIPDSYIEIIIVNRFIEAAST